MNWGLSASDIQKIIKVFENHSEIERVILYGSRAMGNFRPGSDIDLTIMGKNLGLKSLTSVSNELDDLLLPYTFDLSLFDHIQNQDLKDHIEKVGQDFYRA